MSFHTHHTGAWHELNSECDPEMHIYLVTRLYVCPCFEFTTTAAAATHTTLDSARRRIRVWTSGVYLFNSSMDMDHHHISVYVYGHGLVSVTMIPSKSPFKLSSNATTEETRGSGVLLSNIIIIILISR